MDGPVNSRRSGRARSWRQPQPDPIAWGRREWRTRLHHRSNRRTIDLDQRVGSEDGLNGWQVMVQQDTQVLSRYVARLDQEQLPGASLQHMRIEEIRVLGNHNPFFKHRNLADDGILCLVPGREIQRVRGIVSMSNENGAEPTREMRVDEKSHVNAR